MESERVERFRFPMKAGVQYSAGGHTITFNRDMDIGDPVATSYVVEVDGVKPEGEGWPLPRPLGLALGMGK